MIDGQKGTFRFLKAIDMAIPRELIMWHGEDVNAPGVVAAIMRGYAESSDFELAYILVGDVTEDETEPTISNKTELQRCAIDEKIQYGTRQFCHENNIGFVSWTGSQLNYLYDTHLLVSGYIVEMHGVGQQQRLTARFSKNGRKYFIETAFAVAFADHLAKPMFLALHPVCIHDTGQT